ncbi:hypothetical protein CIHG_08441 [Coccidioides immitis H538.4]|uniref:Uncharacterized protein n=2 Tax=Coccidioides immitis TaxID=5501 RepID=A0A0J8RZQ2_COCIT|nr:hypothetical protein CIRG_02712 [Coccidioides immitis RMSCC 2394]KMU90630.1 hypothetical protein CIHG_08441 [Coccidioides immitis H538.4]
MQHFRVTTQLRNESMITHPRLHVSPQKLGKICEHRGVLPWNLGCNQLITAILRDKALAIGNPWLTRGATASSLPYDIVPAKGVKTILHTRANQVTSGEFADASKPYSSLSGEEHQAGDHRFQ